MKKNDLTKAPRHSLGIKASRHIGNTFIYIILVAMTVVWLFPFFGIVLESLKVNNGGGMDGQLFYFDLLKECISKGDLTEWLNCWGFDNYVRLFTQTEFPIWFRNTAIMGIAVAIFQTFFVLSMSYTLSRLRFSGRKLLMNFMLILGMFPGFLTLLLIYKVFSRVTLDGTIDGIKLLTNQNAPIGLIIVYCASSGMGYYVSKGFFDTIPKSLDEAARVDGATRAQVFYKVIMPLSGSIVIYTILMGFMAPWGDFMMAKYISHFDRDGMNVAVGMWSWLNATNINTQYTMFCAAGVVVAIPVVAVFMALQKYYVEGVTGGAVKG